MTHPPGDGADERMRRCSWVRSLDMRTALACAAIVLLAGSLRLWGIGWGLPNPDRTFSLHPDEGVNLVNGVLDRGVARPHLDIGFYNYGSFYFLLWQMAVAVNSAYGFVHGYADPSLRLAAQDSIGAMLLVGRLLSASASALTCVILFLSGRRLERGRAGAIAATLFAVAPLAVVNGHFATVDSVAALLVACTMFAAFTYARHPSTTSLSVAGVLAGLAAATRYNTALCALMPLVAIWRPGDQPTDGGYVLRVRMTLLLTATCVAGFLIGCPGALINSSKFRADVLFEAAKSARGMGALFEDTGNGWAYHYLVSLRHGLGWPALALVSLGVVIALVRRDRSVWIPLAFLIPYYLMMGAAQVRFARYMLPMLPGVVMLTGLALTALDGRRWTGRTALGTYALVVGWTAMIAVGYCRMMAGPDARDLALRSIRSDVSKGSSIAFATTPWYWSPSLLPDFTSPIPGSARRTQILSQPSDWILRLPRADREWDMTALEDPSPAAVIVSDLESQDPVRLRRRDALQFLRRAASGRRARTFGGRPTILDLPLVSKGYLPNDLLYVCPTITVYLPR